MTDTSLVHDNTTNIPDYAAEEAARLAREYDNLLQEIDEALAQAMAMPSWATVETEEDAQAVTFAITRLRDLSARVESAREGEKLPYLRKGTAVDNFFNLAREKLFKRKKTDRDGAADVLQARLHAYNMARLEAERRERERIAAEARATEAKARQAREEAERVQREAEAKAARARSEANKAAAEQAAREAAELARQAAAIEDSARAERQETQAAAIAKPADLMRERHGGAINTMRLVWHVEVTDSMALDMAVLWAFVKDDAKLDAAKAWAKTTNYKKTMNGLLIEQRPDTVVRR